MKRYRILRVDFDTRVRSFEPVQDHWEEMVKEQCYQNCENIIAGLRREFGEWHFDEKLENFIALGSKSFSVVAYHNKFYNQGRSAFVQRQYFPALTAVCALGERVLNHLVIGLREDFRAHALYKKVYRKNSFDDWQLAVEVLTKWGVLLPQTAESFLNLLKKRNAAIHFNPDTHSNDRQLALEAIKKFGEIIDSQFCAFGRLPWLLSVPGEMYIAKEWEAHPFIRLVYLPNCLHLGYRHVVLSAFPWKIKDAEDYESDDVPDDEFVRLRKEFQNAR